MGNVAIGIEIAYDDLPPESLQAWRRPFACASPGYFETLELVEAAVLVELVCWWDLM